MGFNIFHVVHYHKRDLKCQRIIKCPDIKPCHLLQLFYPVYQCVPVHKKLSGCLGYIEIVLKEFIYRIESLFVKMIRDVISVYLMEEYLA